MIVGAQLRALEAARQLQTKKRENMKKNTMIKMAVSAAAVCLMTTSANAEDTKPKREFKNNMMLVTNQAPGSVDNLSEMFTEGMMYGRLRMNAFKYDWANDDTATGNKDNHAFGLGGSLHYKTASFKGVSAMAGLYYSDNPFESLRMSQDNIGATKSGKDTFSRYEVQKNGNYSMAVLAEANLQYEFSKTKAIAGRQIFESFLTKSNDTKMIPNTFEGFVLETKDIPDTKIRGAYFTAQKLRDHTTFHDVITFGTAARPYNTKEKDAATLAGKPLTDTQLKTTDTWNNNDDSAVHKGLSFGNFTEAGADTQHELIVVDASNNSIKGLKVDVTYGLVPDVVSSITGELNYNIALPGGYSLTPGVRYMHQMDVGGGAVGGAGLKGKNVTWDGGIAEYKAKGYKTPDSLDSSLVMARLTLKKGPLKAQIGYSAVGDEADIVAPWRGFPTGGYTRAMAQYNWYANTKTTCAEVNYDFGKAGLVPGFSALVRYAMQDFDEAKQAAGNQADSNILHMDFRETITPNLYAKIRVGLVSANEREGSTDKDSYNEYRFELNYLF